MIIEVSDGDVETMTDPQALSRIFDWLTIAEMILTRLAMFALFLVGLWKFCEGLHKQTKRNRRRSTRSQAAPISALQSAPSTDRVEPSTPSRHIA